MKTNLESSSLQLLQENAVLGIGAGFTAGIGFATDVQRPDSNRRAESQVRQK